MVGVTYLTGYNGIQNIYENNNRFYYIKPDNNLKKLFYLLVTIQLFLKKKLMIFLPFKQK